MQVLFKGQLVDVNETDISIHAQNSGESLEQAVESVLGVDASRYEVVESALREMLGRFPTEAEVFACSPVSGLDVAIARAELKGMEIFKKIRRDNVLLGIENSTIDGRPATEVVLERGANITSALTSGSTKAAIRYCKSLPTEMKDATFLTDERLLLIVNELEAFHGMPLSASL